MKKSWVRKSLKVGVLAAGFLLFSGSAAQADNNWASVLNPGIGNGNQVRVDVQVPVDFCGNAFGIGGDAQAGCYGGSSAHIGGGEHGMDNNWVSALNIGIGNGNQVYVPVQVPIDVCGNAFGIAGDAQAGCYGGATAKIESARTESTNDWVSFGNIGIGNGNQVYVPVQVPINVCGNAIGVGGDAMASCKGGASATIENGLVNDWVSALNIGIGNGNQVMALVQVPINVCGNAIAVAGDASAGCMGGASATVPGGNGDNGDGGYHHMATKPVKQDDQTAANTNAKHAKTAKTAKTVKATAESAGGEEILGGLTGALGGVTGGLTGDKAGLGGMLGGADNSTTKSNSTKGAGGGCVNNWVSALNMGIGNGNQVYVPIQVPIDISGNAVAVGGDAQAGSHGGAWASLC